MMKFFFTDNGVERMEPVQRRVRPELARPEEKVQITGELRERVRQATALREGIVSEASVPIARLRQRRRRLQQQQQLHALPHGEEERQLVERPRHPVRRTDESPGGNQSWRPSIVDVHLNF